MWTTFWDMHSGGGQKEQWSKIYIEAPEDAARIVFYNRFGHSPDRVTCTCCGEDYSADESETLEQATAFHRDCAWEGEGYVEKQDPERTYTKYRTLEQYLAEGDALVIRNEDIAEDERYGSVPVQGYVYV